MVLACIFFIYRMSDLTRIERRTLSSEQLGAQLCHADGSPRVAAWQVYGALFFGAVNKLEELLDGRSGHPEIVVLDMQRLIQLDTTGLEGLENLHEQLAKRHCSLLLCGLNSQPLSLMTRSGFVDLLGKSSVFIDLEDALAHARRALEATAQPR